MSTDLNISDNGRATEVNGLRMGEASRKPASGTCVDDGSRRSTPRSPRQSSFATVLKAAVSAVTRNGYRPLIRINSDGAEVEGVSIDQPNQTTERSDVLSDDQMAEALGLK